MSSKLEASLAQVKRASARDAPERRQRRLFRDLNTDACLKRKGNGEAARGQIRAEKVRESRLAGRIDGIKIPLSREAAGSQLEAEPLKE